MQDKARGVSATKAAVNLASAVIGAYNPFGGSLPATPDASWALAVAPTFIDPMIQLGFGVDGFGRTTAPPKSAFDKRPDSEMVSGQQHGSVHHRLARWLNEATGGNTVRSGAIDVQPNTIKSLGGIVGGGLGRFVTDSINLGYLGANDLPVKPRDIPFYKSFYGEYDKASGMSQYYERSRKALDEFDDMKEEFKNGIKRDYSDEDKFLQRMGGAASDINKAMSELKKYEVYIAESKKTNSEKELARREIQKKREALAARYNAIWFEKESALKRAGG